MTRNSYILEDHKLAIFWTQKDGDNPLVATIVKDILKIPRGELRKFDGGGLGFLNKSGYRCDYPEARKKIRDSGYKSIALMRDPYDRLVSAYLSKFVHHNGKELQEMKDLTGFAQNLYKRLPARLDRSKTTFEGISFAEFVRLVCRTIERRPENGEPKLDRHVNTQVSFEQYDDKFEYDFIYNLNQTNEFYARLENLVGLPLVQRVSNATPMVERSTPNLVRKNSKEVAKLPAFGRAQFESPNLRARIEETFSIDYFYYRNTLE